MEGYQAKKLEKSLNTNNMLEYKQQLPCCPLAGLPAVFCGGLTNS